MSDDQPSKNLRYLWDVKRREQGFTQATAAKKLGWTQGAISQYINNLTPMAPATIIKFANFLGIHPLEIDPNMQDKLPKVASIPIVEIIEGKLRDFSKVLCKKTAYDTFAIALCEASLMDGGPLPQWLSSCYVELTDNLRSGFAVEGTKGEETKNVSAPSLFAITSSTHHSVDLVSHTQPELRDMDKTFWRVISIKPLPR